MSKTPIDIIEESDLILTGEALKKSLLKNMVSSFYQSQKLRIQVGNRIAGHFRLKLGVQATETLLKQRQGDQKKAIELMDVLKEEYKRLADAFTSDNVLKSKNFRELTEGKRGVFTDYSEFTWMRSYQQHLRMENQSLKDISNLVEEFSLWNEFLSPIKGIGPASAAILLSSIDISKADTPASLWKYSGLDVVITNSENKEDGRGRGRFKEHLIKRLYIDREGEEKEKDSVTFNPFLKTKIVGVMAEVFIKHRTPKYRDAYDDYKHRITQREEGRLEQSKISTGFNEAYTQLKEKYDRDLALLQSKPTKGKGALSKEEIRIERNRIQVHYDFDLKKLETPLYRKLTPIHIERMAKRYMMKRFLADYYIAARTQAGLPVVEEYGVRKLGLVHHTPRSQKNHQDFPPSETEDVTPEDF